eukprot:9590246-Ditylum_brightwellii.AAC.2
MAKNRKNGMLNSPELYTAYKLINITFSAFDLDKNTDKISMYMDDNAALKKEPVILVPMSSPVLQQALSTEGLIHL